MTSLSCPYCDKEFDSKKGLSIHISKVHKNADFNKEFECPECHKIMLGKHRLHQHLTFSHNEEVKKRRSIVMSKKAKKYFSNPENRKKASEAQKFWHNPSEDFMQDYRKKISVRTKEALNTPEMKEKLSKIQAQIHSENSGVGISSRIDNKAGESVFCASTWERRFCDDLLKDSSIIDFRRSNLRLHLIGMPKRYLPDFFVTIKGKTFLVEIKSSYTIKDELVPFKVETAIAWCEDHSMTFLIWTEKEMSIYESLIDKEDNAFSKAVQLCLD